MKKYELNQKAPGRGGRREGAGRKSQGKERVTVTLDAENVKTAKLQTDNFSGLMDQLLSDWVAKHAPATAKDDDGRDTTA